MLDDHHVDRVGQRPEREIGVPGGDGRNRWKQDPLLVQQVRLEIRPQVGDEPADLGEFRVSVAMYRFDLGGECIK